MRISRLFPGLVGLGLFVAAGTAAAQSGSTGSLRGMVVDEQGAAMPGVTVTATSPDALVPGTAVTDDAGGYRIINLAPATYKITAELAGFTIVHREGIVLRAGANYQIDNVIMKVGTLEESITVSGDSPMLEVSRPSNVLNVDGDFQREVPVVEGKFWSDFLQITPGVMSRPHSDGSGRQNYFGNAVDHRDAVVDMEGMMASNYNDSNINRTGLSTEVIQDVQVKTGGVDASSSMGYGLVVNMVSKSGGNAFHGTAGYTLQPFAWTGDNTGGEGTPTVVSINQADFSFGGPIKRDRIWFFGAARWQNNKTGTGRTPERVAILEALYPEDEFEQTTLKSFMPWLKISTKLGANHDLSGVYQGDRLHMDLVAQETMKANEVLSTGGGMYGAKLTSVWGTNVTTTFTTSYNNKGGNQPDSYEGKLIPGPTYNVHQSATAQQGRLTGTGIIATTGANRARGCVTCFETDSASVLMLRGDVRWYKNGWQGSHEFETGFLAMPRNTFQRTFDYKNDGFLLEEQRLANPLDPGGGVVPFHRQYVTSGLTLQAASGRDHDIGLYVQDNWKPSSRLTVTAGLRLDFVGRYDVLRDQQRQSSVEVGPRLGFSYLLTEDAKNVLRGTYARMHEQLQGGRHGVSEFGGTDSASFRDTYDLNFDGAFETVFDTPAKEAAVSDQQFDPNVHQPYIDEFILGYRRQFPWQVSLDVAGIYRSINDQFSLVDINGFYPDGPFLPFGGFGAIDPNQGIVYQLRSNDWSTMEYRALQITVTKNLTRGFQAMAAIHRQWQKMSGTWNPTDPARFIAPDAFPNDKTLWRTRGPIDQDSLSTSGGTLSSAPMWQPYSVRLAGTWHAPFDIVASSSYSLVAGAWTGPILDRLATNDPELALFGPSTVTSSTGAVFSNPLAIRTRYVFPTRGEGQPRMPDQHYLGLKVVKRFPLGGDRTLDVGGNILNLLNGGEGTELINGGNQVYSANFLRPANLQAARSFQLDLMFRF